MLIGRSTTAVVARAGEVTFMAGEDTDEGKVMAGDKIAEEATAGDTFFDSLFK